MNTRRKSIHQSVVMSSSHCPEFLSSPNTTRSEIFCVWGEGVSVYVCMCVRVYVYAFVCLHAHTRMYKPRRQTG